MLQTRSISPLWPALAAVLAGGGPALALADQMPNLRRVVLSQGGVGYFEYEATVDGAQSLGLDVRRADVSDVLKSLVVLDSAGGVDSVELPSADPGASSLGALPVPRHALDRPLDLLNALQGVVVTVAGAAPMTGRILHAEPPAAAGGASDGAAMPAGKTRITLLTDAGLQQFLLEDVVAVQVADPALRARLQAAVAGLRGSAAADRRHLTIRVAGQGTRVVHLGVVVAAPLWKAAYRLVLPAEDAAGSPQATSPAARLQGWAVLENVGITDWNAVALTLQSGNPVAFRQAIYQTYFVDRPLVPLDMLAHPLPPVDRRAIAASAMEAFPPPPAAAPMMRSMASAAAAPAEPLAPPAAAAQASEVGVATSFALPRPLSLAAGHTASVPFLDRAVSASRVDLLAAGAAHPLAAVRLVNDTGTGLPPGVVTTYATGAEATLFTGDARLGPLPAGETRVLSYAEDVATAALWHSASATSIASLTAAAGVLTVTRRERTTTAIDLQAPVAAPRRVLVDIPRDPEATLTTEPKLPVAQTAGTWRLEVALAAGQHLHIAAHADRLVASSTVLDGDPEAVALVLDEQGLPPAARDALQRVASLVRDAAARDAARDRLQVQRTAIEQDEARLRANLAAVPATDPLHGKLLQGLAADEDRLSALATAQTEAADSAARAHQAVADAIANLNL